MLKYHDANTQKSPFFLVLESLLLQYDTSKNAEAIWRENLELTLRLFA